QVRQPEQRINERGAALPANIIEVTNTNDSGPGSLRDALAVANDGDEITFAVTGTITLTSGQLTVSNNITISGTGAGTLAVDGNANTGVFFITPESRSPFPALRSQTEMPAGSAGARIITARR